MHNEALPLLVLSRLKKFGAITIRKLLEQDSLGTASHLFETFEEIDGLQKSGRETLHEACKDKLLWEQCRRTLEVAEDEGLQIITLYDDAYPIRLRSCIDAPLLLFYRGQIQQLQSEHIVSIVGTRSATRYGEAVTKKIVEELHRALPDLVIVSGLARGIDIVSHRSAMDIGAGSIAILGFGHHHIYPPEHRKDFIRLGEVGGLLSEFLPKERGEPGKFVARNRIIAGLAPATIVVESRRKGGALITAEMALGYDHDVFAVPGRVSDEMSQGCNNLIAENKAIVFRSVEDFLEQMLWTTETKPQQSPLLGLKPTLPDDPICQLIAAEETILFNDLLRKSGLQAPELHSKLIELELEGYIDALPGGKYSIAFNV